VFPLPLPPGLSSPDFDSICKELRGVVGDDWLISAADKLASYDDPYSPGLAPDYAPSGAILPASVEEIRGVLGIANRHSTSPMAGPRLASKAPWSSTLSA
jgi:4-cresol dehydrogenase (hydroxylating)